MANRAWSEDRIRIQALVDSLIPGVQIRLDANGGWTEEQARQAAEAQVARWLDTMALKTSAKPSASASDRLAALRARVRAKETAASTVTSRG